MHGSSSRAEVHSLILQTAATKGERAMLRPANLVFILSDEHSAKALGCYGHPIAHTPNIDRLAASGVRFSSVYCNSPVCIPARAVIATGRYIHQMGFWDNA